MTGRDFSWLDCFDLGLGSLGCLTKEGAKLYTNSFRARLVEDAKRRAHDAAYQAGLLKGLGAQAAAQEAQGAGLKAAKLASRRAKRVTGPLFSAAWDFFEVMHYGGSVVEGAVRAAGTMAGTWLGGFYGEQGLGRLGFFIGSHLGSWAGGRVGLMAYDVVRAVQVLLSWLHHFLATTDLSPEGGEGGYGSDAPAAGVEL